MFPGERRPAHVLGCAHDLGEMAARSAVDPLKGSHIPTSYRVTPRAHMWYLSTCTRKRKGSTSRGIKSACQRHMSRPSPSSSSGTLFCASEKDIFTSLKRNVDSAQLPRTSRASSIVAPEIEIESGVWHSRVNVRNTKLTTSYLSPLGDARTAAGNRGYPLG